MLLQFKISFQAIIIFLFGILFLHAATATVVGAQGGAHSHREFRNLESQIQNLTQRVEALESAKLTDAPQTEPSASGQAQDSPDNKAAPSGKMPKQAAYDLSIAVKEHLNKHGMQRGPNPIWEAMGQCQGKDYRLFYQDFTFTRCFCSKPHSLTTSTLCAPFR